MPINRIGAGDLYYRVGFLKKVKISDGLGNTRVERLEEQFQCRAAYRHLRGNESVMGERLQGRHVQLIIVRASSATRQVTTDWVVRDVRSSTEIAPGRYSGDIFNIRDVTHETDRQWISLLVEKGVAY
ncbi:head-tail adaptor protein [Chelativorans sp.]|uniref:head-tail adaptor protein n=1 Tax=Chelativorans sp. TaxID=2203393 RepID=UPI002811DECC|nr:head-tail adaptor protein [Chelativorans sp.]